MSLPGEMEVALRGRNKAEPKSLGRLDEEAPSGGVLGSAGPDAFKITRQKSGLSQSPPEPARKDVSPRSEHGFAKRPNPNRSLGDTLEVPKTRCPPATVLPPSLAMGQ